MTNDLEKNFVVGRGDLIYGFENDRKKIISRSPKIEFAKTMGLWITANDFNNNTILRFNQFYDKNYQSYSNNEELEMIFNYLKKEIEVISNKNANHFFLKPYKINNLEQAIEYIRELYNHCPPNKVKELKEDKLKSNGDSYQFKMIRRSCKFGIRHVAGTLDNHAKVHFILDGLPDDKIIVNKIKYKDSVPITISEIRYIFRQWNELNKRIIFYHNTQESFAPWEVNPVEWREYAMRRFKKYEKLGKKIEKIASLCKQADVDSLSLNDLTLLTNNIKHIFSLEKPGDFVNSL